MRAEETRMLLFASGVNYWRMIREIISFSIFKCSKFFVICLLEKCMIKDTGIGDDVQYLCRSICFI